MQAEPYGVGVVREMVRLWSSEFDAVMVWPILRINVEEVLTLV